jgi:hypothetical protein
MSTASCRPSVVLPRMAVSEAQAVLEGLARRVVVAKNHALEALRARQVVALEVRVEVGGVVEQELDRVVAAEREQAQRMPGARPIAREQLIVVVARRHAETRVVARQRGGEHLPDVAAPPGDRDRRVRAEGRREVDAAVEHADVDDARRALWLEGREPHVDHAAGGAAVTGREVARIKVDAREQRDRDHAAQAAEVVDERNLQALHEHPAVLRRRAANDQLAAGKAAARHAGEVLNDRDRISGDARGGIELRHVQRGARHLVSRSSCDLDRHGVELAERGLGVRCLMWRRLRLRRGTRAGLGRRGSWRLRFRCRSSGRGTTGGDDQRARRRAGAAIRSVTPAGHGPAPSRTRDSLQPTPPRSSRTTNTIAAVSGACSASEGSVQRFAVARSSGNTPSTNEVRS